MKENDSHLIKTLKWVKEVLPQEIKKIGDVFGYILLIADYENEITGKGCFASQETLANKLGVSLTHIKRLQKYCNNRNWITVEKRSENKKKTTNEIRINKVVLNSGLRKKGYFKKELLSNNGGVSEKPSVRPQGSFKGVSENYNKLNYKLNYNSKDLYKIKNLSKDLTPKEFKSFSKYKKKRLMNESEVNAKVHDWLMKGKITDFDVN